MKIKTSQNLVLEASKDIKTICAEEGLKLFNNKECNLIDIRDEVELQKNGRIENSYHISRGLLEFSIHPDSAYFKNKEIDIAKEMVLFCAAGGRAALAVKTLKEMGFEKVSHIEGGFGSMQNSGFKVKK